MRFAWSIAALIVSSLAASCGGTGAETLDDADIVGEEIQKLSACDGSHHLRPCQEALGQQIFQGVFLGKGDFAPKLPEFWGPSSALRTTSGNFIETAARIRQLGQDRVTFCKSNPALCHQLPGQPATQLSDSLLAAANKFPSFSQGSAIQAQVKQRIQAILTSEVDGTLYETMRNVDPDIFVTLATETTSGNPLRVSQALQRATDTFLVATVPPVNVPQIPSPPFSGTIFAQSPATSIARGQCVNAYIAVDVVVVAVAVIALVEVVVADRSPWGPNGLRNTFLSGTITNRFNHI